MTERIRGERVRELRKGLHLSQYDLEDEFRRKGMEVRQSWISQVEQNKGSLRPGAVAVLADILNTSSDYLLGVTDDPTPRDNLKNQVMLIEQDPERRAHLQTIFNGVSKLPAELRAEYYDVLEILYRGIAVKSRRERDNSS